MTLASYLKHHRLNSREFAEQLGLSTEAVRRYVSGERLPTVEIMQRIFTVTRGKVEPNDFYGLPSIPPKKPALTTSLAQAD